MFEASGSHAEVGSLPLNSAPANPLKGAVDQKLCLLKNRFRCLRDVFGLLHQLLVVEEKDRLGSDEQGADLIKQHSWFAGLDWEDMLECQVNVPKEILSRLELALDSHYVEESHQFSDTGITSLEELNTPLWLEDW